MELIKQNSQTKIIKSLLVIFLGSIALANQGQGNGNQGQGNKNASKAADKAADKASKAADKAAKAADKAAKAATKAANEKAAAAEADMAKKLAKKLASAETKLQTMRDDALANLNDVAAEAAQETVKQLIGVKATKAEVTKQVKAAAKAAAGA